MNFNKSPLSPRITFAIACVLLSLAIINDIKPLGYFSADQAYLFGFFLLAVITQIRFNLWLVTLSITALASLALFLGQTPLTNANIAQRATTISAFWVFATYFRWRLLLNRRLRMAHGRSIARIQQLLDQMQEANDARAVDHSALTEQKQRLTLARDRSTKLSQFSLACLGNSRDKSHQRRHLCQILAETLDLYSTSLWRLNENEHSLSLLAHYPKNLPKPLRVASNTYRYLESQLASPKRFVVLDKSDLDLDWLSTPYAGQKTEQIALAALNCTESDQHGLLICELSKAKRPWPEDDQFFLQTLIPLAESLITALNSEAHPDHKTTPPKNLDSASSSAQIALSEPEHINSETQKSGPQDQAFLITLSEAIEQLHPLSAQLGVPFNVQYHAPLPAYLNTNVIDLNKALIGAAKLILIEQTPARLTLSIHCNINTQRLLFSFRYPPSDPIKSWRPGTADLLAREDNLGVEDFLSQAQDLNELYQTAHRLGLIFGKPPQGEQGLTLMLPTGPIHPKVMMENLSWLPNSAQSASFEANQPNDAELSIPNCHGNVLLADNLTARRSLLAGLIRATGVEFTLVDNGVGLADLILNNQPDLILIGDQLPFLKDEFLNSVFKRLARSVPVVYLNRNDSKASPASIIAKEDSVDIRKLYQLIEKHCHLQRPEVRKTTLNNPVAVDR